MCAAPGVPASLEHLVPEALEELALDFQKHDCCVAPMQLGKDLELLPPRLIDAIRCIRWPAPVSKSHFASALK